MNYLKTLPVLVALLFATSAAMAAPISYVERFQKDDGDLNLYLRTAYMTAKVDNPLLEDSGLLDSELGGTTVGGHGVGLILDYSSPYLANTVGIDASYYAVKNVDSEVNSVSMVRDEGDRSVQKIGQLFLKGKYVNDGFSFYAQAGRGRFETGTIETRDTRIAPSSYQGARIEANLDGFETFGLDSTLKFSAAKITRSSLRDESEFYKLRSETGETIDSVVSGQAEFDMKLLRLRYSHGVAKDFNKNQVIGITLRAPLPGDSGMLLNYQFHKLHANGDIWDADVLGDDGVSSFDDMGNYAYADEATFRNINLAYMNGAFAAAISYSKSHAPTNDDGTVGYAYFNHGENVTGNNDGWTMAGNDFTNDGETTYQLGFEYDMNKTNITENPLDGVFFRLLLKRGTFDATDYASIFLAGAAAPEDKSVTEKMIQFQALYRFDEQDLEGLSAGLIMTKYYINEDFVAAQSLHNDELLTGKELRIYVDYAF